MRVATHKARMSKMRKALWLSAVLVALSFGSAAVSGYRRLSKFGEQALSEDAKAPSVRVVVTRGSSARQVASQLEQLGIIRAARQFYWYVRLIEGKDTALRPGEYDLSPSMTPRKITEKMTKGDVVTHRFTIPEGSNLREIARIIGASGLATEEDINAATHDEEFALSLGVPTGTQTHSEGYIFPDTYRFASGTSARVMLRLMNARLKQVLTQEVLDKARKNGLTPHQLLTLASIVEKETGAPQERPQIAAVFHNRLKRGWKLQTDPTVIYGIDNYSGNISKKDLEAPHPYNTYTIPALPPGPIASPGAAAILAAAEPADVKSMFFVSMNNGTHIFCETLRCHEDNVRKWQVEFFKRKKG